MVDFYAFYNRYFTRVSNENDNHACSEFHSSVSEEFVEIIRMYVVSSDAYFFKYLLNFAIAYIRTPLFPTLFPSFTITLFQNSFVLK